MHVKGERIPAILAKNVQRSVAECCKKFRDINKMMKKSRSCETSKARNGEEFFRELFYIGLCKCRILSECRYFMWKECRMLKRAPCSTGEDGEKLPSALSTAKKSTERHRRAPADWLRRGMRDALRKRHLAMNLSYPVGRPLHLAMQVNPAAVRLGCLAFRAPRSAASPAGTGGAGNVLLSRGLLRKLA